MGKLLPRSCFPVLRNVAPLLTEDKEKEDSLSVEQSDTVVQQLQQQQRSSSAKQASVDAGNVPSAGAECGRHASTSPESSSSATAGRLFVFRDPPQSCDLIEPPRRKKKKNFLNLKRSTVAPTDLP